MSTRRYRPVARQHTRPLVAPARARQWARDRGIPVGARGRVPRKVMDAYRAERRKAAP